MIDYQTHPLWQTSNFQDILYSLQCLLIYLLQEELEDTKGVIRICKSNQHNGQRKKTKGQTTIYKTLHRKLKIK